MENPDGNPAEGKTPSLNRNNLEEDVPAETEQTVCQPDPSETVHELSPKTTPASTEKKKSANKEGEGAVQESLEFQDDPADTDYAPSKYMFGCNMMLYMTIERHVILYFLSLLSFAESQMKSAGTSYTSSRGRRIRKPVRRHFPLGELAMQLCSVVSTQTKDYVF